MSIFFLPVIYALSVGPAVFLCSILPSSEPYIGSFYPDLENLKDTPLYQPMHKYNDWWQAHSSKPR